MGKISVLNTKVQQLQNEIDSIRQSNEANLVIISRENQQKMKQIRIKYESKLSQSDLKMDELKNEIVDLRQQIKQLSTTKTTKAFNLDFFNTQSEEINNEDEDDVEELFKYKPYEEEEEDDENEQIKISQMD